MAIAQTVVDLFGLGKAAQALTMSEVILRGIVVFFVTLLIVRVADRRFMARLSAFDVVLGFILASMLARAVNGTAALGPTFVGGLVLVGLHRLLGWAAYRSDTIGTIIKGRPQALVKDGVPDERLMRAFAISLRDVLQEARLNGNVAKLEDIQLATIERSGDVSIVRRKGVV